MYLNSLVLKELFMFQFQCVSGLPGVFILTYGQTLPLEFHLVDLSTVSIKIWVGLIQEARQSH